MLPLASSCLLPPDGSSTDILGPYAPQVDLRNVFPRNPLNTLDPNRCASENNEVLRVEVEGVVDLDTTGLLFRWVANNRLPNTKLLDDEESNQATGMPHSSRLFLDHVADFEPDPTEGAKTTGVLSLFITDAPSWAEPEPRIPRGEAGDLSELAPDLENADQYSVVELRWTFEYFYGKGSCDVE